jgi:hypothetical protein
MITSMECRERAVECRQMAKRAPNVNVQAALVDMAQTWERLALQTRGSTTLSQPIKWPSRSPNYARSLPKPYLLAGWVLVPNETPRVHHASRRRSRLLGRSRCAGKPAFVSSDRTAQQPSAIRPDRTGRRNRPARDRWQALEQALADFAVAALAFEQD